MTAHQVKSPNISVFHLTPHCLCHAERGSKEESKSAHTSELPAQTQRQHQAGGKAAYYSQPIAINANLCHSKKVF